MSKDRHSQEARFGIALDRTSRFVLARFVFTLVAVLVLYCSGTMRLSVLELAAAAGTLVAIVLQRERFETPYLNRWDEAAA